MLDAASRKGGRFKGEEEAERRELTLRLRSGPAVDARGVRESSSKRSGRCERASLAANMRYFITEIYQMSSQFVVTVRIVAEVIERQGFSVATDCQERRRQGARKCRWKIPARNSPTS